MSDDFPQRLKACRERRALTQTELAERSGLPSTSISHFEKGARKPSFDNLRRLAKALDVQTDYLLGLTDGSVSPVGERLARHVENSTTAEIEMLENFAKMLRGKDK